MRMRLIALVTIILRYRTVLPIYRPVSRYGASVPYMIDYLTFMRLLLMSIIGREACSAIASWYPTYRDMEKWVVLLILDFYSTGSIGSLISSCLPLNITVSPAHMLLGLTHQFKSLLLSLPYFCHYLSLICRFVHLLLLDCRA